MLRVNTPKKKQGLAFDAYMQNLKQAQTLKPKVCACVSLSVPVSVCVVEISGSTCGGNTTFFVAQGMKEGATVDGCLRVYRAALFALKQTTPRMPCTRKEACTMQKIMHIVCICTMQILLDASTSIGALQENCC